LSATGGAVLGKFDELNRRMSLAVMLNRRTFEHAKELINEGSLVFDERDSWSEHRPSTQQETEFIRNHGFSEYAKWYPGNQRRQA
jgi:hypothetical protein